MLTQMTEQDWAGPLEAFRAVCSRRGDKGRDDRKFLEALHSFTHHNITLRDLPAEFGPRNSVWKRFWHLREAGVLEAFLETRATMSSTAHLVQMFDFTIVRAKNVSMKLTQQLGLLAVNVFRIHDVLMSRVSRMLTGTAGASMSLPPSFCIQSIGWACNL
jgi:transposase